MQMSDPHMIQGLRIVPELPDLVLIEGRIVFNQ